MPSIRGAKKYVRAHVTNMLLLIALAFVSQTARADGPMLRLSEMGGLGTAYTHQAVNPAIAHNPDDRQLMVFWEGTSDTDTNVARQIFGRRIDALSGFALGTTSSTLIAQVTNTPTIQQDATRPAAAYNSTNHEYLVTFVGEPDSDGASETEVYGQRVDATGDPIGEPFAISDCGAAEDTSADVSANIGAPQDVVYNPTDNQYLVVWRCDDVVDGEFEIFGRIVNAVDGTLAGGEFQISQTVSGNSAESPRVAYDSTNNRYLVVWGADNLTSGERNREIHGQCLSSTGAVFGDNDFQISASTHDAPDSAVADVAFNPATGQYLTVWAGDTTSDGIIDIFGQLVNANCASLHEGNFQISSTGTASEPNVAYDAILNQYFVTWHTAMGGEAELYRQTLTGDGFDVDGDTRVTNLGPDGNGDFGPGDPTHGLTHVAGSGGCFFVAVASDHDQGGQVQGEQEIFYRRLGDDGACANLQMTVDENQSSAITVSLAPELENVGFALAGSGDNDNGFFSIDADSGDITFNSDPDFEMPDDADGDNVYEIDVVVTDGNGNMATIRISITVADAADLCQPELLTRFVGELAWQMLHPPCQPPTDPAFAFGDLLVDEPEDNVWAAYYYDATAVEPAYVRIAATDPIPDQGFWFITLKPVTLMLPATSTNRLASDVSFCDAGQCYEQTVREDTSWNLLGSPLEVNYRYTDMLLTNDSTDCQVNAPCSLDAAASELNIESGLFQYNSFSGNYLRIANGDQDQKVVKPWDGYWIRFIADAAVEHPWKLYLARYPSQYMFVTDGTFDGNLSLFDPDDTDGISGIAGADAICQQEAITAGLPGTYKAYLSTSSSSPSSSFNQLDTPYIRPDGALFANGFNDFLSGDAGASTGVDMGTTATLNRVAEEARAWTSTDDASSFTPLLISGAGTCDNWTTTSPVSTSTPTVGTPTDANDWEFTGETSRCDLENHLYCTQQ